LIEQTLESRRRQLGGQHPDTLDSLNALGGIQWRRHKLDKSIPLFEEELRVREATMAPDHPGTLQAKANLGVNYRDAGRLDEGLALLEEVHGKRKISRHCSGSALSCSKRT
jgi:eukaryotic-like serine/threonine-protein kinase